MTESVKDALFWALLITFLIGMPVLLIVSEPKPESEYIKDHNCIRDKDTPFVGTSNHVKALYLCDNGPRGRDVWMRQ